MKWRMEIKYANREPTRVRFLFEGAGERSSIVSWADFVSRYPDAFETDMAKQVMHCFANTNYCLSVEEFAPLARDNMGRWQWLHGPGQSER
jgi:hypothetical protein